MLGAMSENKFQENPILPQTANQKIKHSSDVNLSKPKKPRWNQAILVQDSTVINTNTSTYMVN